MGDGIQPFFRGLGSCAASGLVGLIHGGLDSSDYGKNMPDLAHHIINYAPILGLSTYVASSKYGLWTPSARAKAFGIMVPLTAACEFGGYWVGRTVVASIDKIVN